MTTRRALFGAGAGALALLAGCGAEEKPKVDVGQVLGEQLKLTQAVADAYQGVPGDGRADAQRRVALLETALKQAGGTVSTVTGGNRPAGAEVALAAESAALRGHVAAVGQLGESQWRELLAGLIADAAAGESALLTRLKRPPLPSAFPGQPV